MSITHPIGRFSSGTFVVTRRTIVPPVNGRKVAGAATTISIPMSQQPANGAALKVIPEARMAEDVRVIYCKQELRMLTADHEPDLITFPDGVFEVFKVEVWPRHWRAYAARQDRP